MSKSNHWRGVVGDDSDDDGASAGLIVLVVMLALFTLLPASLGEEWTEICNFEVAISIGCFEVSALDVFLSL